MKVLGIVLSEFSFLIRKSEFLTATSGIKGTNAGFVADRVLNARK